MPKSTFQIKSTSNKSFGTAFCIEQDDNGSYLLTCQHVVDACGKDDLEVDGQKAILQERNSGNDLIDLAVVYVKGLVAKPLALSLRTLSEDALFEIDGFKQHQPGKYKQEALEGSIKKVSQIHNASNYIDTYELYIGEDDNIEKGYSGSAIVAKNSGQVVAVATDRTTTGKQAYAIPLKYLKEVWEKLDTKIFDRVTPFVGLSAFGREDSPYFFGRDREIEEILTEMKSHSILAVIGDSGSGKSSLIKAGVIPAYIKQCNNKHLHIIEIRPARNPFVELARFIATLCDGWKYSQADTGYFMDKVKSQEPQAIQNVLEQLFKEEGSELLLYIDQFEELFTLCNEDLQKKFTDTLLYILKNQTAYLEIKVIFTMRRDYYNLLKKHEVFYQSIEHQTYKVRRMKDENLREVIEKPLEMLSVDKSEIEQLSNTMIWDLGDESKEITLLQIALTETWLNKAKYEHDLMRTYVGIGRVTGALSYLATNAMESLDAEEKKLFEYIFIRIVKFNDMGGITRRLADRDEFSEEAWKLVQKLASVHSSKKEKEKKLGRLLKLKSSSENEEEEVIELIHETLTTQWETYVEWIRGVNKENRKRIHNVLITKSKLYKKDPQPKFLLSGYALEEGRKLLDDAYRPYLSGFEKEFIAKSEASEARTRFWKRFGIGTLVVLLGLSGYFGFEANRAKNKAEQVSEKLINIVTDVGDMAIDNQMEDDPNAFKMFSLIVKNFKDSKHKKILQVVSTSYVGMGLAYGNQGKYEEAIQAYKEAVKINPKYDEAYYNMGIAYDDQGKYEEAIIAYKKAVKINPKDDDAYTNMGNAYANQGKYEEAIKAYKEAVKINPKKDEAYNNIGVVYADQGKYEEAIKAYEEVVKINSKRDNAYANFFELQLIQSQSFNKELEEKYIELFQEKKEIFIDYEMLKILQNITQNKEVNLEEWKEKYNSIGLEGWSFNPLDSWLAKMDEGEIKVKLTKALEVFKKHAKESVGK